MIGKSLRAGMRAMAMCACTLPVCAAHAEIRLLNVEQERPGELSVRIQSDDVTTLHESDFFLKLSSSTPAIAAVELVPIQIAAADAELVIGIDRSGSMSAANVSAIVAALKQTLATHSRLPVSVSITTFATNTQHITKGFTDDPVQIENALSRVERDGARKGLTQLNDAVASALAELRASAAPYRRVLIISDGSDEGSRMTEAQVVDQALGMRAVAVDAVALGELAAANSGSLAKISGLTNGRFVYAEDPDKLTKAVSRLVDQFANGHRYRLGFDYAPAGEGQMAHHARLLHHGEHISLQVPVSAAALRPPPPPQPNEPESALEQFLKSFSIKLRIIVSLAVLAGAGVAARKPIRRLIMHERIVWRRDLIFWRRDVTPTPLTTKSPGSGEKHPVRRATRVAHSWPPLANGQAVAMFEGRGGTSQGRRWMMNRAKLSIGSSHDNDIVLEHDDYVSARHAVFKAEGDRLHVSDLGSRNGTCVNGETIRNSSRPLLPGDRIDIGKTTLEVMVAAGG
ncbi:MAG TPA: FHA domain-containing protein [Steroidobacter sp.]